MVNILLAEHDRNCGAFLQNAIEDDNLNVDLVDDGLEAVLSFISGVYDFVLLDIGMARLNGIDALRIIKKINPDVPAIVISDHAGSKATGEAVEAGAMKCEVKPFAVSRLKEEIQSYLAKHRRVEAYSSRPRWSAGECPWQKPV